MIWLLWNSFGIQQSSHIGGFPFRNTRANVDTFTGEQFGNAFTLRRRDGQDRLLKSTRFFLLVCQARRMNEMRIQNTTNSIANAICRFCVKGLSVSCILSGLQRQSWHGQSLGVSLAQLSLREGSRVYLHVLETLRNLMATAARMLSDMDANLECWLQAYRFAFCPVAVPVSKTATLGTSLGKPVTGGPDTSFRKRCQVR
jgi:hypothetical protein